MSKLTQLARGQTCTVRLGCCVGRTETVVAAHYRSLRLGAGTALKPHDLIAADACQPCHDEIDRRTRNYQLEDVRMAHAEGVMETILRRVDQGAITFNSNTREMK